MIKHMEDCAVHEDGPCTCGTEEELEAIAFEEGLTAEDFEKIGLKELRDFLSLVNSTKVLKEPTKNSLKADSSKSLVFASLHNFCFIILILSVSNSRFI